MTIKEIAHQINTKSVNYGIGDLQSIRKDIKQSKRRAGSLIFGDLTIADTYAFHYGGRSEIQYNIGFEEENFRYGLAFSLALSQSLPDISILYPKILKLNCIIREQPEYFKQFQMWYWKGHERSETFDVIEIGEDLIKVDTFIFFGKILNEEEINIEDILQTFDDLLWVYKEVETDIQKYIELVTPFVAAEFIFQNKDRSLPQTSAYTTIEREIDIDIRHSFLQESLQLELVRKFGKENVSVENSFNTKRIDIVVRDKGGFHFYEVKTAISPKACVRQAIGQLLEYAFGNGQKNAKTIFVAGEFPLDNETDIYLTYLREVFKIPIYYKKIELIN